MVSAHPVKVLQWYAARSRGFKGIKSSARRNAMKLFFDFCSDPRTYLHNSSLLSPVFAGDVKDAKSEQDCVRDGGTWDDMSKTCSKNKM
jgi:hypothetical protein